MATSIFSILASNYSTVGTTTYSNTKYVPVDPTDYEGTWTGKYGNSKSFSLNISNVQGFKAVVRLQGDGTTNYGQVLIKDGAFRLGDSKFVLQGDGSAVLATAETDPETGQVTLQQGYAARS